MKTKLRAKPETLRQRRRDAGAEALLDAAERVISEKGYERVTMQEIAAAAGCAAGTLYLYFRTKEELVQAMTLKHGRVLVTELTAAMEQVQDPVEKMRMSTYAHMEYLHRHPAFFRSFYAISGATIESSLRDTALKLYAEYRDLEISIVQHGQEIGRIRRDIPARELVELMHGMCMSTCARWLLSPKPPPRDEQHRIIWLACKALLDHPAGEEHRMDLNISASAHAR